MNREMTYKRKRYIAAPEYSAGSCEGCDLLADNDNCPLWGKKDSNGYSISNVCENNRTIYNRAPANEEEKTEQRKQFQDDVKYHVAMWPDTSTGLYWRVRYCCGGVKCAVEVNAPDIEEAIKVALVMAKKNGFAVDSVIYAELIKESFEDHDEK